MSYVKDSVCFDFNKKAIKLVNFSFIFNRLASILTIKLVSAGA
jgi:hypothetical protein